MAEEILPHFRVAELPNDAVGEIVMDVEEGADRESHKMSRTRSQPVGDNCHSAERKGDRRDERTDDQHDDVDAHVQHHQPRVRYTMR